MNAIDQLIEAAARLDHLGALPATSGNLSTRDPDGGMWISRSGASKGRLAREDFVHVPTIHGTRGPSTPTASGTAQPSAEAALHLAVYAAFPECWALVHTHGLGSMVVSRRAEHGLYTLHGWELQKALEGRSTHAESIDIAVIDNEQDMNRLALRALAAHTLVPRARRAPALLIRGHGLYAWGTTVADAARHAEALEVLFQAQLWLGLHP